LPPWAHRRAGLKAVVEALRDELFPTKWHPLDTEDRHIWEQINEILASDGVKLEGSE